MMKHFFLVYVFMFLLSANSCLADMSFESRVRRITLEVDKTTTTLSPMQMFKRFRGCKKVLITCDKYGCQKVCLGKSRET